MLNKQDLVHFLRGLLMGGADIIPGVSGGTIALILGIYQRLVTAISKFDRKLLNLLSSLQWRAAGAHVDFRFLLALGLGIVTGIISLASLMHNLLEYHRAITMAGFFGLILASSFIVGRMVIPKNSAHRIAALIVGILGVGIAYWIVSQSSMVSSAGGLGYVFVSGMIGICAMILPGISGSYILLLLGMYSEITGIIKKLPKLAVNSTEFFTLCVFAAGCLVGLLLFSRLLRWLLARWHTETLSLLCGFMLGSLYRIWPFQKDLTPEVLEFKHKSFEPYLPNTFDQEVATCLIVAIAACAAVLLLTRFAAGQAPAHESDN